MNTRVSFYTLGCRLNQAETAILQRSFEQEGYRVVDFRHPADVVVINTCTVTENGDADTRKIVNKINRTNPEAKIALVGCQAQIQREKLLELSNVHWVVGNARKMDLAAVLRESADMPEAQVVTPVITRESFTLPVAGVDRQHTRANLKIQDGCDFFCSFCVIPYARGRARSREYSDIFSEARQLLAAGHREIVLTGINVGTYRQDDKTILDVIDDMLQLDGLERLRISSIEPTTIPQSVINRMSENLALCRHLHIPLQSGSDQILKAMNRHYTAAEFADFIRHAHNSAPGICLGTDVMVGFPGETDAGFEETYHFLLDLPLAYFHVFSYSERPGAKSRKLENPVPQNVIERRSRKLRELSARKRRVFMEQNLGSVQTVLFEQIKKGYWNGLTDTYIRVKVKSDADLHNRLLPVKLEEIDNNSMMGTLL
ncbi:MAG: tRNA (N(6)-L-threonylcarbamoyladenosine(37)-C(2))-methylthiotransferase MtaB [Calditrichia bacterium]